MDCCCCRRQCLIFFLSRTKACHRHSSTDASLSAYTKVLLVPQKSVPSDMIMIGGSFVFGRDTSAISLPPCTPFVSHRVLFATTWLQTTYLPRAGLQHLRQTQLVLTHPVSYTHLTLPTIYSV